MKKNAKVLSFVKATSLTMFFITFAINYLASNATILESFIRGTVSYIFAAVISSILLIIWRYAFPDREWKTIIDSTALQFENAETTADQ
ncbi:MAG: hypothetical protein U9N34_10590 [Candidatus Cloacimonadota bacterium]|nr:hypothetical protein [Candidatus Cloacimonadota bacterium]